jgi:hypothetical protein
MIFVSSFRRLGSRIRHYANKVVKNRPLTALASSVSPETAGRSSRKCRASRKCLSFKAYVRFEPSRFTQPFDIQHHTVISSPLCVLLHISVNVHMNMVHGRNAQTESEREQSKPRGRFTANVAPKRHSVTPARRGSNVLNKNLERGRSPTCPTRARREQSVHGRFLRLRNFFDCKTTQSCATRRESEIGEDLASATVRKPVKTRAKMS